MSLAEVVRSGAGLDFAEHDPYRRVLPAVFPGAGGEELRRLLQAQKEAVRQLRRDYRQDVPRTDYTARQRAYMLAYYPHHIETLPRLLHYLDEQGELEAWRDKQVLRLVCFGSGPAPEIPGLLLYLQRTQRPVRRLEVLLIDCHNAVWQPWRKNCTDALCADYAPQVEVAVRELDCNLLHCGQCRRRCCASFLGQADLAVMQNSLTDLVGAQEGADGAFSLLPLFSLLPARSLFVCSDLRYERSLAAMRELTAVVADSELGELVWEHDCYAFQSCLRPRAELDSLFDSSDDLWPRCRTQSRVRVCRRLPPPDWVLAEARRLSGRRELELARVEELQFCRRCVFAAGTAQETVDVYYDKRGLVTKVRSLAPGAVFADVAPLAAALKGRLLVERPEEETAAAETPAWAEPLRARLAAAGLQLQALRPLPYLWRCEVTSADRQVAVVDQCINGRGEPSQVVPQRGMSTSVSFLEQVLEVAFRGGKAK